LYGATEALIGMQMDKKPYIVPFYNACFFEVITKRGVKMLYELEEGELGTLITSSLT